MTKEYAEQLFLQEKPTLALLAIWSLQKTYASVITKEINSTFAHTTKILAKMEEHGLVQFSVEGRVKYVELTDHGYQVVDALKNLIMAIEGESPEESQAENSEDSEEGSEDTDEAKKTTLDHIDRLHQQIMTTYKDLAESNTELQVMRMKIGPFSRDIQLLLNSIEENEDLIDDEGLDKLTEIQNIFDLVMKQ
ncbi:MarR family transcriptional regulator [Methanolobus sediminis]|uniref:MarR family transcriptional regulator n=1 Tax=Methanolobus sediminis TaxID=3072978 RepID=A0AA51UKH8_9EURY|nr:MarR family transcriptional regulator [Methanolobus sediminis]WMW25253.1 MarR family transcriptional regulator [Methanolobus sediminis]